MLSGWKQFSLSHLFLMAGLFYVGLQQARHIPFFFFTFAALLPVYGDAAVQPLIKRLSERRMQWIRWICLSIAVILIIFSARLGYAKKGFFNIGHLEWYFPEEATTFIQEHNLPPNLFNTYDWGGYLMWRLYPDYLVFWDGRVNNLYNQGKQVLSGDPEWQKILDYHEVRTIVLGPLGFFTGIRFRIVDQLKESQHWVLVFADEAALVFVKPDAVDEDWLRTHQLPKSQIDDTMLLKASLIAKTKPKLFMPYAEMVNIYSARKEYDKAVVAMENYLSRIPSRDPRAEEYYKFLLMQSEMSRMKQ
jgi:hypothetical protein